MKFLIEWDMKPKYRKEAAKAIEKFQQPKEMKTVLAAHNCVASNRGIAVAEVDDVKVIQKTMSPLLDYVNFTVTPIIPLFPD
ncbi:MAG: DUF3303 domain-containing protein [Candidatus Thorarchaeota archaeon]|nr:MAG: DUF3303 domain-containing protein [Candidatus Thorarchaeota archaeon]